LPFEAFGFEYSDWIPRMARRPEWSTSLNPMDYNNIIQEGEDVIRAAQDRPLVAFRDREIDAAVAA